MHIKYVKFKLKLLEMTFIEMIWNKNDKNEEKLLKKYIFHTNLKHVYGLSCNQNHKKIYNFDQ